MKPRGPRSRGGRARRERLFCRPLRPAFGEDPPVTTWSPERQSAFLADSMSFCLLLHGTPEGGFRLRNGSSTVTASGSHWGLYLHLLSF